MPISAIAADCELWKTRGQDREYQTRIGMSFALCASISSRGCCSHENEWPGSECGSSLWRYLRAYLPASFTSNPTMEVSLLPSFEQTARCWSDWGCWHASVQQCPSAPTSFGLCDSRPSFAPPSCYDPEPRLSTHPSIVRASNSAFWKEADHTRPSARQGQYFVSTGNIEASPSLLGQAREAQG